MNLTLVNDNLKIEWKWYEQLLAGNLCNTFVIPLEHITAVSTAQAISSWSEIRSPGLVIPGLIKAGTYYTKRGKEFWYVIKDQNCLILELKDESFQRIILTADTAPEFLGEINQFI
ncbi:hypothetical protein [Leptolyngbya sp. FACHB-17]|uniref:hypothetical protein n=1 Tax=unclassified Leptolyngbya TaxID=2650499 RepID=UPI0016818B68|nr:hypothetical protein [Leptolyngbya sp. FACHB-17]MBD2078492.1 hypothetical protein [Leptolyngbya sp. FACHB-17]